MMSTRPCACPNEVRSGRLHHSIGAVKLPGPLWEVVQPVVDHACQDLGVRRVLFAIRLLETIERPHALTIGKLLDVFEEDPPWRHHSDQWRELVVLADTLMAQKDSLPIVLGSQCFARALGLEELAGVLGVPKIVLEDHIGKEHITC